jgi:RNA polymerase sigma-70 factor (ECF subfamily)
VLAPPLCFECGPDDESLEHGLAAGDDRAFALLVDRETANVFRICYRVLGNREDARAATGDAFSSAHRALGAYPGGLRPGAWLASIAAREAWEYWASRSTDGADVAVSMVLPDEDDPDHDDMDPIERAQIRHAVSRLPEPYREIVMLWFYGKLSLRDIGAATRRSDELVVEQIGVSLDRLSGLIRQAMA